MLKRKASTHTFVVILLTLVSLSLSHSSFPKILSAETINVPEDYPTIQAAINAATAGDTILVASGTYYENLVIAKSLTLRGAGSDVTIIDGGGTGTGVKIAADSVNMSGFMIRNSGDGVHLYQCNGVTVSDNKITSNKNDGIYVESSDGNTIRGNTITSNKLGGIFIGYSSDSTISDNLIASNAHEGVYLCYSSSNTVSGNIITSHANWPAISLEDSSGNTIGNNTLFSNKWGIDLYEASGNIIVGNTISNSSYYGVSLFESSGNAFYHNNFIGNAEHVSVSWIVLPKINSWNNSLGEGNYWSDYNGTDADGDGIGDTPYEIDATNQDNHPLMNPYDKTKPVADAGPDQLILNGTNVTFDGSKSSDNLDIVDYGIVDYTWTFTDNTSQVLTGVEANYTFRNIGNFSVTLNVSDHSGNWDTDQMWVNVTETRLTRDVAITSIKPFPITVTTGDLLLINVTVANQGNMSETFNVTVYYDSSVVGMKKDISLASGANNTVSFNWNTTGVPGGNYTIKAVASIVAGETDTADNEGIGDKVIVERLSSTISISALPQTIIFGNSTTISGSIIPIRVEVNVMIHYSLYGGSYSILKNVTTGADGSYSYEWTPNTTGTYEVKAIWPGDATTLPAESNVTAVTVNMASSTILLIVSSASVTVGSNITISGAISPARAGVNVTIEYRPSGGNWTTLATVTTDSEGNYSCDWRTTEPGSYEVKTSWEGDDNTLADESDVWNVTVKEGEPATDIYLYAVAIAAVIVLSATAVYVLKVRKPRLAKQPREHKL